MKKATRILTIILILSIVTTLYCLYAAPLLEPDSKYKKVDLIRSGLDMATQQILTLFGPNDWESKSFRHLEINKTHFFLGKNSSITDNCINIDKCTIVIVNSEKPLKAILVRCLGDIKLEFRYPISFLGHFSDNRLIRGKLIGEIHVVSKGDEETLSLETHDFSIDRDIISTNANVYFKYGRTQGVGTGLQIQLINHGLYNLQNNKINSGPISQKIANITLQKLKRLTIVPPVKKEADGSINESSLLNSPIELSCDGPFVFNALNKCASFEQNVSLIQTVSNKGSNSIRCQELKLLFTSVRRSNGANKDADKDANNESTKNSDSKPPLDEWNLQIDRLEAIGQQVVVEAPEYQTKIHANKLVATLSPLSFELESATRCELYYKNHHISTPNLFYKVGENGTLGILECSEGWISSQIESTGKKIRARWSEGLRLKPDQEDPKESVISLQGSALMELENNNNKEATIRADGFAFWVSQKENSSTTNGFGELSLTRMQANDNVVLKSNPITAAVKKLQLWFEQPDDKTKTAQFEARNDELGVDEQSRANASLRASQSSIPDFTSALNSYSVIGDLLQGRIVVERDRLHIDELTLRDNVRVVQNDAPSGSDAVANKLEMSGSQIRISNLTHPSASASLFGQPAVIQYGNATLSGDAINVSRGSNQIWINSGGEAEFKPQAGISKDGELALPSPASLISSSSATVRWSKSMAFQDDTLTFTGKVSLKQGYKSAECDSLSIILNKKVDFQKLTSAEEYNSLDARYVILNNSVDLKNKTAENGVIVAEDELKTSKLTIDMKKQTLVAEGPGEAITQRKMTGTAGEAGENSRQETADVSDSPSENSAIPNSQTLADSNCLIKLSVNFQKRLEGSFAPHSISTFIFSGYVQAFYTPIDEIGKEIKTTSISQLPPQAFTLTCDKMEIQAELGNGEAQKGIGQETSGVIDSGSSSGSAPSNAYRLKTNSGAFIASGGVSVEGRVYNARADKIMFEAKNGMMTLEGDGQIPARLFYQKVLGGRYNQASSSTIYYNTQTGAVKGEGIQDFSLFLSPKNSYE